VEENIKLNNYYLLYKDLIIIYIKMCGILFTIIDNNLPEILDNFNKIKHRGPDNTSYKIINNKFLGVHRLSIINQSETGNQPFELNGVYLICNGQIYNYIDLANKYDIDVSIIRSDVDIILHLYNKFIDNIHQLVNLLDGDFAFVIYDSNLDVLYISRDIVGVRPLFYSKNLLDNNIISVSSEIKGLTNSENVNIFVYEPSKLIKYDFKYNIINECNYVEECQEENIVYLLKKAVEKRIENSERPVAFLCSGGLDSSIILCIANEYLKNQNKELHVFTIKYVDKNGNCNSEDDFYCNKLVQLLNVKFTSLTYNFDDVKNNIDNVIYQTETYDPNTVRTSIANYLFAKKIKELYDYKVFLSGEGADELFCGYLYFNQTKDSSEINKESNRLVKNIHMFDILKADRCFNAFGLEVRVPFLDKNFITYVKSIDGHFKAFTNSIEKNLLRVAFKKEYPVLTEARIIDRPKERFSDGVSFSYVPDLLNYCSNYESSKLSVKENSEKIYYKTIFNKYYPNLEHVIINRVLPDWCLNLKEVVNIDNDNSTSIINNNNINLSEYSLDKELFSGTLVKENNNFKELTYSEILSKMNYSIL
jgi:asparagine synthase (glutamine-hydrolysing)